TAVAEGSRSARDFFPRKVTLPALKRAAEDCRGCDLYQDAIQTVFGDGSRTASLMLIGEQPGDEEDKRGLPFVGPAGRVLAEAMEEAGIDRAKVYLTNVVKHFKWKPRGKRRIHQKPRLSEILACRPWLDAEIEVIEPKVILCLGATAAQTLLGSDFRVTKSRGEWVASEFTPRVLATFHPSAILRSRTKNAGDKPIRSSLMISQMLPKPPRS